jgi:hypothetical protein
MQDIIAALQRNRPGNASSHVCRTLLNRLQTTVDKNIAFDPYSYTHGRWLNRDTKKREARQMHFDFDALLDVAIRSSRGASKVVYCEKKEGSFSRAFMISLDNRATVVAKLPYRLGGPPRLTVASEVATLQYGNRRPRICLDYTMLLTTPHS